MYISQNSGKLTKFTPKQKYSVHIKGSLDQASNKITLQSAKQNSKGHCNKFVIFK